MSSCSRTVVSLAYAGRAARGSWSAREVDRSGGHRPDSHGHGAPPSTRVPDARQPAGRIRVVQRNYRAVVLMRLSTLFLRTLRDDPADAEIPSHKLLVRAGYIRRVGPGS